MKKILILCAALIMLMGSVCSAAPVRIFDGGVNDFVTLYNQMAQEIHSNMKAYSNIKFDIKLYQHPFKNAAASFDNYTAYTCKVGNKEKLSPYITLFVDQSGYVSQIAVLGFIIDKKGEPYCEELFAASTVACVAMLGLEQSDYENYINNVLLSALQKENYQYTAWSQLKHRRVHIDTKRIATIRNDKRYQINIYGTNK